MSCFSDDAFTRSNATSGWGSTSDGTPWSTAFDNVTMSIYEPSAEAKDTFCPICVLLLETEEGQEIFGKYMMATARIISDGMGNATTERGWKCSACGAIGEGRVPEFHDKPKEERPA